MKGFNVFPKLPFQVTGPPYSSEKLASGMGIRVLRDSKLGDWEFLELSKGLCHYQQRREQRVRRFCGIRPRKGTCCIHLYEYIHCSSEDILNWFLL